VENSFKAVGGQWAALRDPAFFGRKADEEKVLRTRVASDPKLAAELGDPWKDIEDVQDDYAALWLPYWRLESGAGGGSSLFGYARALVRSAQERAKPAAERLPEYGEARLALLEKQLTDARPIDAALGAAVPAVLAGEEPRVPDRRRAGDQAAARAASRPRR
jgi:hypothetical protein